MPFYNKAKIEDIFDNAELTENGIVHERLAELIKEQRLTKESLFLFPFCSIQEYLLGIEFVSRELALHSTSSLSYMCSAVSDFYIPVEKMPEHKIQSRDHNELDVKLFPVPKMLGDLKNVWNPKQLAVSFKLETDANILEQKALGAIEKYQMDLVIANLLQTRRTEVVVYKKNGLKTHLKMGDDGKELEQKIVEEVKKEFANAFPQVQF